MKDREERSRGLETIIAEPLMKVKMNPLGDDFLQQNKKRESQGK
jgi:hypothetical protein